MVSLLSLVVLTPAAAPVLSFAPFPVRPPAAPHRTGIPRRSAPIPPPFSSPPDGPDGPEEEAAAVSSPFSVDDDEVRALFAWTARAILGEGRYQDVGLAVGAALGHFPPESEPASMLREALSSLPPNEDEPIGGPVLGTEEREVQSLGPLGAAQWTGQRAEGLAHSLLDVSGTAGAAESWEAGLPRGCRYSLRRARRAAADGNFTVSVRPISGEEAPHSSLSHFRCVVQHELRAFLRRHEERDVPSVEGFLDTICEAVERFVITTRMVGDIYEYRNASGHVVAFLHEVRKGRTTRAQWFYATDEAARGFIWFHCLQDLVYRGAAEADIDTVDIGPNGSDGKSDVYAELKSRYGFALVEDWPLVANYRGPFWR